ncbi:MAG: cation:proton antiporter [Anaerolineales bacterium]|jgi:Kef-type K+ transport system membrane component KefB
MTNNEIGNILLTLSVLLASTHFLGYLFERLRQPRLVGEILAGILIGPFVLGRIAPSLFKNVFGTSSDGNPIIVVMEFIYWFGLLLLMFISGSQVRRVFAEENRQETAWILGIGTPLPFFLVLALGLFSLLPLDPLVGAAGQKTSTLLILSIAVAVTSIPVISRIFYDLKILHTRFASLILGAAVLEDIILWTVLAIATALANNATLAQQQVVGAISNHIWATVIYIGVALFLTPHLLRKFHVSRWNIFLKSSPLGYVILVMFLYAVVAAILEVNLVFAAFLAGFGVVGGMNGSERERFSKVLESIEHFSSSTFIPIYFTLVGFRLVFGTEFSFSMLVIFLIGSSLLALITGGLAAKLAGFKGLDIVNIAITTNARGGPGIVLASVAYDAGIISAAFYTTLVLAAVITSQLAGGWLRFVLTKGWPLLSSNPEETWNSAPKSNKVLGKAESIPAPESGEPSPAGIPVISDDSH